MPVNQQKKTGQARLRQAIEAPTNRGLCNLKANKTVFTQTVIRAFLVGERNAYHQPSNRATEQPANPTLKVAVAGKAKVIFTICTDIKEPNNNTAAKK